MFSRYRPINTLALISMVGLACSLPLSAQQEIQEEGVVQQQMVIQASDDGDGSIPSVQFFSSSMGDGGSVMLGNLSSMMPSDPFSLANNKGVQKEIELVDDQLQQMKEINKEFSKRMQEQIKELTSGKMTGGRGKELAELMGQIEKEKKERLAGVLLPHQLARLKQIGLQNQMRQAGDSAMLTSSRLMEELDISDEQKKRLKERSKELKDEMDREIKKLKAKARESLMKELSSEQRKKLKEMVGDDFEMKRESFADRLRTRNKKSDSSADSDSSDR